MLLQSLYPSASVTMLASATRANPTGPWLGLALLAPFLAGFGISLNSSCCFPRISLISSGLGSSSSVKNQSQQVPKASQPTLGRNVGTATRESRHEGSSSLQLCSWPANLRPAGRGNPKLMERTTSILLLPLKPLSQRAESCKRTGLCLCCSAQKLFWARKFTCDLVQKK